MGHIIWRILYDSLYYGLYEMRLFSFFRQNLKSLAISYSSLVVYGKVDFQQNKFFFQNSSFDSKSPIFNFINLNNFFFTIRIVK